MRIGVSVLLGCFFITSKANDTTLTLSLLQRVKALQVKDASVFPKGAFASYRTYQYNRNFQKADINGFYTGLIVLTLRDIQPKLTTWQQQIADSIIQQALPVFDKFKNRKGRDTYNFWPTDTAQIFPNSGWLNWFNKSQSLPDDLDDTVIILLAQHADPSTASAIHTLMQGYTNNPTKRINNTFPAYRNIGAYSTWFGEKMPIDFDVSVLSNVLFFVQRYQLNWKAADSASLELIDKVITDNKHIDAPSYISPHYASTPILLYHFSRLMQVKPITELEKHKPALIENAKSYLQKDIPFMEKLLLATALKRWGINSSISISTNEKSIEALIESEDFSFFIANMASMYPNKMKKLVGKAKIGEFRYYCPAYNHVLVLENILQ
jgi:hypothetical protein